MSQFLKSINLSNFRNYHGDDHQFDFYKQQVFIIGPNATGKSNLLEAIQHLSFGAETARELEKQILNLQATQPFFSLKADFECYGRDFRVDYASGSGRKSLKINGVKYRSLGEAKDELLKTVTFRAKESLEIVRGSPGKRREWLDLTLSLLDVSYRDNLRRYEAALEQRNALLKSFLEGKRARASVIDELQPWNQELAIYGCEVQAKRLAFLERSQADYASYYCQIAGSERLEKASIQYEPCGKLFSSVNDFVQLLEEKQTVDLMRAQTSVGPHRDDFVFVIDGQEARHYASQGQQRTSALALKLLQLSSWRIKLGYSPILLLDDVAAELDLERQKCMFASLPADSQIFLTTTHLVSLPSSLIDNFQIINLQRIFQNKDD